MTEAKTSGTRAWFFPTSPRSPYKIPGELALLKNLDGKKWDRKTQLEYADLLRESKGFEGRISKKETAFSARDRTRAPKMLGLIILPGKGKKSPLKITEAGNFLLNLDEENHSEFFLRQIAKVQFPSPFHNSGGMEEMNVKPLGLVIAFLLKVKALTKQELALFVLTCTRSEDLDKSVAALFDYREKLAAAKAGMPRKTLREDLGRKQVELIYKEDIQSGRTQLREGGADFVGTKLRTLRDYADSSIRYLLCTGLFTLNPRGQTFEIAKSRLPDALSILGDIGTSAKSFTPEETSHFLEDYLGSIRLPNLQIDSLPNQTARLNELLAESKSSISLKNEYRARFESNDDPFTRALLLRDIVKEFGSDSQSQEAAELVLNREQMTSEIAEMFSNITSKNSDIIDRPLMYEWNTWRLLTSMNDALSVIGNFKTDVAGNPLSTASGKMPDIVAEYRDFWLACEVTLQSGFKQYETESEPITRHVGNLQKEKLNDANPKPVFGLFVAEKINAEVVNFLMLSAMRVSSTYGGKVQIIPVNRISLEKWMLKNAHLKVTSSEHIRRLFLKLFDNEMLSKTEEEWFETCQVEFENLSLAV